MSSVEPEVWMVQWTYDGEVWVDAHADEPRARDRGGDRGGECLPMVREASYASSQAEIERLKACLADLSEASRNACNAAQHTPLVEALFEADRALSGSKE